jgi:seryl-tRNA synthetase
VSWLRRQPPPPPAPERTPHPDSRVEAELQRVLAAQRAARRAEERLEEIRAQRAKLEDKARRANGHGSHTIASALRSQSRELSEEAAVLESGLPAMYDEISGRLAALGDDALMLYGPPS